MSIAKPRALFDSLRLASNLRKTCRDQQQGRSSAFLLSVSQAEKKIALAEFGNDTRISSARIHKSKGQYPTLSDSLKTRIQKQWQQTLDAGVSLVVKGYADRLADIPIPDHPNLARIERSIFGPTASKPQKEMFAYLFDKTGLYFDGRTPSDLERILNQCTPGSWQEAPIRQSALESLRASGFQKYNHLTATASKDIKPPEKAVLLVGQVSGDAATLETASLSRDNYSTARLARETFPNHPIYYKPHPFENSPEECSRILTDFSIQLIDSQLSFQCACQAFETVFLNTSGGGLEAALLGCQVYTCGVAFYSHYGFTQDLHPAVTQRQANLSPEDVYLSFLFDYAKYARADSSSGQVTPIPATTAIPVLLSE